MFLSGRRRLGVGGYVQDVVAADRDQSAGPLGPQRGHHTRGSSAPIVADQHRALDPEPVHQGEQIMPQRCLLAGAQRVLAKKARRAEAAQVRRDCAIAGTAQVRHDLVPRARIVGKAVQEDDRGGVLDVDIRLLKF